MATCGIWKVETRLDYVINYTTNIEKTIDVEQASSVYVDLHNTIEYVTSDYKTERQHLVSGINCLSKFACKDMMKTKKRFNKTDGILGFHSFQSFKEGEVTPDQAHAIGVKLAEEMWGDRFEVVVSTHVNTNHIHNHFVINSVSFVDGKKYYDNRESYALLRHLNDSICAEYGLSTLKEKACRNSKINYANYCKGAITKSNYHTLAKEDIDRAISWADSIKDFENLMKAMEYEVIYRANKISIRRYPYKQNIRIERSFGEDYSIDNITKRIETTHATRQPFPEAYGNSKTKNLYKEYKKAQKGGIYALYLYYCYLLKVFPDRNPRQKLTPTIRADLKIMNRISNEAKLLEANSIKSREQLLAFKNQLMSELDNHMDKRSKLWYKHKKVNTYNDKSKIRLEIDGLSSKIREMQEGVKLCEDIERRSLNMERNILELNENHERKEIKQNELK